MKITCVVDDRAPRDSKLKAEHGISFFVESGDGRVLFDTGRSGPVLMHNMAQLGIEPQQIEALILSHAHNDHTGGLLGLLDRVGGIPLHAHPNLFCDRFQKTDTGPRQVGPAMERDALAARVVLRLSTEPVEVIPGVWTTGEISARPEAEGRSPYHIVRQGTEWIPDPYRDDLSVVLKTDTGLVLLCGCCHAGLLNTLAHVRRVFDEVPVAVVGGTHLVHADGPAMERIVVKLQDYGPPKLWVGHCTSERVFLALKAAFGDAVALCQTGTVLSF